MMRSLESRAFLLVVGFFRRVKKIIVEHMEQKNASKSAGSVARIGKAKG